MKTRFVALALIVIMLSSPSISLADRNTIPFEINKVNAVEDYKAILSKQYDIDLFDGVTTRLGNNLYHDSDKPYQIELYDGVSIRFLDENEDVDPILLQQIRSKTYSAQISDGVATKSNNFDNNDTYVKIVTIKLDHDRKALWERIFPLERIRNGEKQSLYKVIQDDHVLLYLQ